MSSTPENWDEASLSDAAKKLNSLNVHAPVFIPNFLTGSSSVETSRETEEEEKPLESWEDISDEPIQNKYINNNNNTSKDTDKCNNSAKLNKENLVTDKKDNEKDNEEQEEEDNDDRDAVEDKVDEFSSSCSTVASTPDDEEMSYEDSAGVPASKPRTKVKPRLKSETTTCKEHVNVVFIGHVDAGKSTIGGQIMYLTGMVDRRTLDKYEREAKEKNRETWYLSWCMDTNLEEREKGKTVEVGRASFETERKHFTILDAPGHKSFVPNMIGGASQADLAVLVISARKGEFETGFERGGQTREHAMLVKTAGVKHLVVLINKMDDPTVKWSEERYNYCKDNLTPYLKKVGFNPVKDVMYMPVSGLTGIGLKDSAESLAPWYSGQSFISYIDSLPSLDRNIEGPFMMPIVDKYADMGTVVMGKVESGECKKGQTLAIYPNRTEVKVDQLWSDDIEVTHVSCGENVKVKIKGVEETDITSGFVLCDPNNPIKSCRVFDAQVVILEHRSIICAGKSFVLHLQAIIEDVILKSLICLVDKKSGEKSKTRPRFIKQDQIAIVRFEASEVICMERFKDYPQLGRFTLRDEGKTIAIGKILKLIDPVS